MSGHEDVRNDLRENNNFRRMKILQLQNEDPATRFKPLRGV
jgi:hypothetical protein